MLLAIDMGNTQTALGLFDSEELLHSWRMPTDRTFTKDELHVRLLGYFHKDGFDLAQVNAIAFAGVVPQLMREWEGVAEVLNARLVVVGRATASVTSIDADFGTATNIDVINEQGAYIGGCIAPGIRVSLDALTARAARLASVPLEAPEQTVGRNTVEAVQSGTVVGAAAMAEGLVARIKRELGRDDASVIATGGLARVVAEATGVFDVVDPQLTIKGICEIYRRLS